MTQLPREVARLYPFEHHYLPVAGGHLMHYVDEGAGAPLLMVHGNPTWSFHFREAIIGLRSRYRCIALDHIGCGLSAQPNHYPYRIIDHVANLVTLVDRLNLRDVTLVMHDWGGPIGYLAALQRPDRFRRFVVMNSAAFLLPLPWPLTMLRLPGLGLIGVRHLNLMLQVGYRRAVVHRERLTDAVRAGYRFPYASYAQRKAMLRFIEEIPLHPGHHNRHLLEELEMGYAQFRSMPHLICWGLQDPVFHDGFLQGWRQRAPTAEVHAFADASHWVLEDAGDRILPLMQEFLDRTGRDADTAH